jgi:hypothetical protein
MKSHENSDEIPYGNPIESIGEPPAIVHPPPKKRDSEQLAYNYI